MYYSQQEIANELADKCGLLREDSVDILNTLRDILIQKLSSNFYNEIKLFSGFKITSSFEDSNKSTLSNLSNYENNYETVLRIKLNTSRGAKNIIHRLYENRRKNG